MGVGVVGSGPGSEMWAGASCSNAGVKHSNRDRASHPTPHDCLALDAYLDAVLVVNSLGSAHASAGPPTFEPRADRKPQFGPAPARARPPSKAATATAAFGRRNPSRSGKEDPRNIGQCINFGKPRVHCSTSVWTGNSFPRFFAAVTRSNQGSRSLRCERHIAPTTGRNRRNPTPSSLCN